MDSQNLTEACLKLADDLELHWSSDEHLNHAQKDIVSRLRDLDASSDTASTEVLNVVTDFANYVYAVLQKTEPPEFKSAILQTLADATRNDPVWRSLFGLAVKQPREVHQSQLTSLPEPDSILEVARRVIAGHTLELEGDAKKSALRLIANCCADNNVNRSVLVHRDGIEALLGMILEHESINLAVPTLYNVCVDFDEPARDDCGKPWPPLQQSMSDTSPSDDSFAVSGADQRIGTYLALLSSETSFEILLKASRYAPDSIGLICELIESASRVALYRASKFKQKMPVVNPTEESKIFDTTRDIVQALTTDGVKLAREDIDCRVAICQAMLNLMSQPESRTALLTLPATHIMNTLRLPYAFDEHDVERSDHEAEALELYQKAFLKLTYDISSDDIYADIATPNSALLKTILNLLSPSPEDHDTTSLMRTSMTVLLANSIVTLERAETLLKTTSIAEMVPALIHRMPDPATLLPTIDIATRLCLCPMGQELLHRAGLLQEIQPILEQPVKSEIDTSSIEVQRSTIGMLRLLIKGQLPWLTDLTKIYNDRENRSITTTLIKLFATTTDDQSKVEIGRLSIEILRTIFSFRTTGSAASQTGSSSDEPHFGTLAAESLLGSELEEILRGIFSVTVSSRTLIDSIAHIILGHARPVTQQPEPQSQPQSQTSINAEAEAWFGLALLASVSSLHDILHRTLTQDGALILKRADDFIQQEQAQPTVAQADTSAEDSIGSDARKRQSAVVEAGQERFEQLGRPGSSPRPIDPRLGNVMVFQDRYQQGRYRRSQTADSDDQEQWVVV